MEDLEKTTKREKPTAEEKLAYAVQREINKIYKVEYCPVCKSYQGMMVIFPANYKNLGDMLGDRPSEKYRCIGCLTTYSKELIPQEETGKSIKKDSMGFPGNAGTPMQQIFTDRR